MNLSQDEASFVRRTMKDRLAVLHKSRQAAISQDKLVELVRIESDLNIGEEAWDKLKKVL